jgi:hypothetical protein
MSDLLVSSPSPAVPPEVEEFAVQKGVNRYLNPVIELAQQAFPSSALSVSLGQDAEDETHQYIALDVEAGGRGAEQLLVLQRYGERLRCPWRLFRDRRRLVLRDAALRYSAGKPRCRRCRDALAARLRRW